WITFGSLRSICTVGSWNALSPDQTGQPFRFGANKTVVNGYLVGAFAGVTLRSLTARTALFNGHVNHVGRACGCFVYFHVSVTDLVIKICPLIQCCVMPPEVNAISYESTP